MAAVRFDEDAGITGMEAGGGVLKSPDISAIVA
jgi:hypothetical protein